MYLVTFHHCTHLTSPHSWQHTQWKWAKNKRCFFQFYYSWVKLCSFTTLSLLGNSLSYTVKMLFSDLITDSDVTFSCTWSIFIVLKKIDISVVYSVYNLRNDLCHCCFFFCRFVILYCRNNTFVMMPSRTENSRSKPTTRQQHAGELADLPFVGAWWCLILRSSSKTSRATSPA